MTKVTKCNGTNCINEGQDKIHGQGMRVFNETSTKIGTAKEYRCTVCLSKHK